MRHPSFTCSVCNSAPEVLAAINSELQKNRGRKPLRILAEMSGLSKSAISRHSCGCLFKQRLTHFRDRRFGTGQHYARIVLKDSTSHPPIWTVRPYCDEWCEIQPFNPKKGFRRDDLVLEILPDELRPEIIQRAAAVESRAALLSTERNRPEAEDADE